MPKKTEILVSENGLTRRAFLAKTAAAGMFIVAASGMGILAACKSAPAADLTISSNTPDPTNHGHDVTIAGADLDNPPAQKVYTTTATFSHTHTVSLTRADLEAIKKKQTVTVVSSTDGTPAHSHTFELKLAA